MGDKRKYHFGPKRSPKRKIPHQTQIHNLPTDGVEKKGTNQGGILLFANKPEKRTKKKKKEPGSKKTHVDT